MFTRCQWRKTHRLGKESMLGIIRLCIARTKKPIEIDSQSFRWFRMDDQWISMYDTCGVFLTCTSLPVRVRKIIFLIDLISLVGVQLKRKWVREKESKTRYPGEVVTESIWSCTYTYDCLRRLRTRWSVYLAQFYARISPYRIRRYTTIWRNRLIDVHSRFGRKSYKFSIIYRLQSQNDPLWNSLTTVNDQIRFVYFHGKNERNTEPCKTDNRERIRSFSFENTVGYEQICIS